MSSPSVQSVLFAIRRASKTYSGIPALIEVSLDLHAGEVHALMGENGAGKSTLIKLMAGVLNADSMQIEANGLSAAIQNTQDAFKLGLRFIHQELQIIPQLSVAENIFLGQRYPTTAGMFVRWRQLNNRAREVLAHLGVTHIDPSEIMARLNPGDQMLVNIAHAFVGDDSPQPNAAVYVMDEPTASLSAQETGLLFDTIQRLRERGSAVLYVSHRMDEIFKIADRVTVMRDGRVVDTLPITQVTSADLIRMMTGRTFQQAYPPREVPVGESVLLDVRELSSSAVRDVSFTLREGEILGIAGLNGAGRTEVLRALMGADKRLSGAVLLDNYHLPPGTPADSWPNGIAYVPEERRSQGLVMSRSISSNMTLPQLRLFTRGGIFLNHLLERRTSYDLGDSVHLKSEGPAQTVRELSGGNQQKVVFARALARPPRLLLLDEPTRGVDVGAKVDLYTLIRQISAGGTGIIMVSSDLPELLGMTDRVLVMRAGRMVDVIPTAMLTEETLLARCYGEVSHERATE